MLHIKMGDALQRRARRLTESLMPQSSEELAARFQLLEGQSNAAAVKTGLRNNFEGVTQLARQAAGPQHQTRNLGIADVGARQQSWHEVQEKVQR